MEWKGQVMNDYTFEIVFRKTIKADDMTKALDILQEKYMRNVNTSTLHKVELVNKEAS